MLENLVDEQKPPSPINSQGGWALCLAQISGCWYYKVACTWFLRWNLEIWKEGRKTKKRDGDFDVKVK
ncbi:60S ribosomal protein L22 [Histoplasma capsulatum var. duboisii H88]|uniref:60S ribosomal protein L22 n=1 Tax=Ajellomyces capsulatus (strain H88) TaxID=544711 RepID=A0A8A1LGD4_AJEC8|nr:60S ribosomal protein L22 [Histoplasma capsulatum var. duboisii H88]